MVFFIQGYVQNQQAEQAIKLFKELENHNEVILIVLFHACAYLGTEEALQLVKNVSRQMPKPYQSNSNLLTSLLDASMKCGDVPYAESWFNRSTKKDLSMYGAMMKGKRIRHHHSFHTLSFQDI